MICTVCRYMYQIVPRKPDDRPMDASEEASAEASDDDQVDAPYYSCRNCGHFEPIPAGEEIYSRSYRGEKVTEDYSMDFFDPTLARTRQYHCPKKSCTTHKNPQTKKAIITQTGDAQVVYLCTICKSNWHPVFQ